MILFKIPRNYSLTKSTRNEDFQDVGFSKKYLTSSTSRLLLLRAKSGKEMDEGRKEGNDKTRCDSIIQSRSCSEIMIPLEKWYSVI